MIKSELVSKLTEQNPHLYQRDIEQVVNAILDTISDALAEGRRVELRGFGTFTVKKREARMGRNPRTGEAVSISEKLVPVFRTSKEMRHRLNPASQRRIKKRSGAGGTNVRALVEIPTTNLQPLPGSDQNKAARPGLDYLKQTCS